jgi:uncharacterized membrane protein
LSEGFFLGVQLDRDLFEAKRRPGTDCSCGRVNDPTPCPCTPPKKQRIASCAKNRQSAPTIQEGTDPMTDTLEPNRATPPPSGFDMNRPTIINLLFLASYLIGFTAVIGVVLAYVWRGEGHEPWEATHYQYQITTFWVGLAGIMLSFVLMIVLIGFLTLLAVAGWILVRVILSMIAAQKREPMPNPGTFLF